MHVYGKTAAGCQSSFGIARARLEQITNLDNLRHPGRIANAEHLEARHVTLLAHADDEQDAAAALGLPDHVHAGLEVG